MASQVPAEDRAALDKLARSGNSSDPLAVEWRERVDAALANPDGITNSNVADGMETLCPSTVQQLRSY